MTISSTAATALLLAAAGASAQGIDWAAFQTKTPPVFQGQGTYYGVGQNADGACSYGSNAANSLGMPWTSNVRNTVALNDAQWNASAQCGLCIKYRGLGPGQGTKPVPPVWQLAFVDNRCPECEYGAIDLGLNGDGRWDIEWYPVPCVGAGSLLYSTSGNTANPYFMQFAISNTRVPIEQVQSVVNGKFNSLQRLFNNQWQLTGGPFTFPIHLRVTSVLGDSIDDFLTSKSGNMGTAQFPDKGNDWFINAPSSSSSTSASSSATGQQVLAASSAAAAGSAEATPEVSAFGQISQSAQGFSQLNPAPVRNGSTAMNTTMPNTFSPVCTTANPENVGPLIPVKFNATDGSWVPANPIPAAPAAAAAALLLNSSGSPSPPASPAGAPPPGPQAVAASASSVVANNVTAPVNLTAPLPAGTQSGVQVTAPVVAAQSPPPMPASSPTNMAATVNTVQSAPANGTAASPALVAAPVVPPRSPVASTGASPPLLTAPVVPPSSPGNMALPAAAGSPAATAAPALPATMASASASASSASSVTPSVSSFSGAQQQAAPGATIQPFGQCGGTGAGQPSMDAAWPGVSCAQGTTCQRWAPSWWQCRQPGQGFGRRAAMH